MVYGRPRWPIRTPRHPEPPPSGPRFAPWDEPTERGDVSRRASNLAPSLIRDIADAGIGQADIIPLWFGEGCWPSPDIAVETARRALAGEHLNGVPGTHYLEPEGAFYSFFGVDGMTDSVAVAKHILASCGVGLAPGLAFGPHGEGHLRLCFAQRPEKLTEALERLAGYFGNTVRAR